MKCVSQSGTFMKVDYSPQNIKVFVCYARNIPQSVKYILRLSEWRYSELQ